MSGRRKSVRLGIGAKKKNGKVKSANGHRRASSAIRKKLIRYMNLASYPATIRGMFLIPYYPQRIFFFERSCTHAHMRANMHASDFFISCDVVQRFL